MQKYPGGGYKEQYYTEEFVEDFSFKDDYHYSKGSRVQMMPGGHSNPHLKHNMHGYENGNHHDNFNGGHDGYTIQYTESRYEQHSDPWSHRKEYPGYGGRHHETYKYQSHIPQSIGMDGGYMSGGHGGGGHGGGGYMGGGHGGGGYGGGGYGGYGMHHGPQHHKAYGEEKPIWNAKAIRD